MFLRLVLRTDTHCVPDCDLNSFAATSLHSLLGVFPPSEMLTTALKVHLQMSSLYLAAKVTEKMPLLSGKDNFVFLVVILGPC